MQSFDDENRSAPSALEDTRASRRRFEEDAHAVNAGRARREKLQRQEVINVLFSFGWLTLTEISFYSDLPVGRIKELLEGKDGLLQDGTVAKRTRTQKKGRVTRARTEFTVDPY